MKRSESQNKRLYLLLTMTHMQDQKADLVRTYTNQRTEKSSEMDEQEMEYLLERLQEIANTMQQQRRRIFSKVYSITLADSLDEAGVLEYVHHIKNLHLELKSKLNDYNTDELSVILRHLEVIAPKEQLKKRNNFKIQ